jgi:hypothetical protein
MDRKTNGRTKKRKEDEQRITTTFIHQRHTHTMFAFIYKILAAKLGSGGSPRPKAFVGVRTTTIPSKCMNKTASLYRFGGPKNHTIELIIVLEAQSKIIHE